jgi:peptidoglycan/LPS O-acetylase OafA/YrhL
VAVAASYAGIRPDPIQNLYEYFLFIQNLYYPHPAFFGEAWSLSVEEIFYFSFPILTTVIILFLKVTPKLAMLCLGIAILLSCTIARFYVAEIPGIQWDADIRKVVLLRMDAVMVGVLSSFVIAKYQWTPKNNTSVFLMFLCFIFSCLYVALISITDLNQSFFAKTILFNIASIGCLGFILAGYSLNFGFKVSAFARFLANVSYSAYLSNLLVISFINYFLGHLSPIVKWMTFFPCVVLISFFSYSYFEKPFIAYRNKNFKES